MQATLAITPYAEHLFTELLLLEEYVRPHTQSGASLLIASPVFMLELIGKETKDM